MPSKSRLYCYFGCKNDGPLHQFPNPVSERLEDIEKFNTWKAVLDLKIQKKGHVYIYNNIHICYNHFQEYYRLPSRRLTKNAVPTLYLGRVHHFPPSEYPYSDKLDQWKMVLSEVDKEKGNNYILNNIRICDHHFEKFYQTASGRLTKNAVPTLNIDIFIASGNIPSEND